MTMRSGGEQLPRERLLLALARLRDYFGRTPGRAVADRTRKDWGGQGGAAR
jgi:hypothetical protein